jgi:eukaryotic-like serine/threonine-protein kinase
MGQDWRENVPSRTIRNVGAAPAEGTVLLGKLRVEQVLGEGGMGVVCRAHHLHLDQPVAIKFLLPQMVENPAVVQRFLREAQAAVKLRGEHVARVIDVGRLDDGCPYMVMEYLEGADLGQILKHYGAQSPQIAADLMLQACEGIAEAHALGIIHRDVKPSNFFITRRPDGTPLLKILDFGISSAPTGADSELTRTQSVIGTPAYMAPEQMRSARAADSRSDVWSMGVVLYQTLSGRRPFESEAYSELCLKVGMDPPTPLDVDIPDDYTETVMRCLEKNPDKRFQNVGELAWGLVPFATEPALARGSAERASRILGVAGGRASGPELRISHRMSTPVTGTPMPVTPPPHLRATVAIRPGGGHPISKPGSKPGSSPGSNSGSYPGAPLAYPASGTPSQPNLPLLSQGPMAPTQLLPQGEPSMPTTASAGAGQVSISRSMPSVTPSRSGWLIGLIAVTLIGVGGWFILQQTGDDDAGTHAAGGGDTTPQGPGLPATPDQAADPTATTTTTAPAAVTDTTNPADTAPTTGDTTKPADTTPPADTTNPGTTAETTTPTTTTTGATTGTTTTATQTTATRTGTTTTTKTGGKKSGSGGKKGGRGGKTGGGKTGGSTGTTPTGDDIFGSRK